MLPQRDAESQQMGRTGVAPSDSKLLICLQNFIQRTCKNSFFKNKKSIAVAGRKSRQAPFDCKCLTLCHILPELQLTGITYENENKYTHSDRDAW